MINISVHNTAEYDALMALAEQAKYVWRGGMKPTEYPYSTLMSVVSIHPDHTLTWSQHCGLGYKTIPDLANLIDIYHIKTSNWRAFAEEHDSVARSKGGVSVAFIVSCEYMLVYTNDVRPYTDYSNLEACIQALAVEYQPERVQCEHASDKLKPSYYCYGGKDLFDHLEEMFTPEMLAGFLVGNIFKYTTRYSQKNGVEDLEKAKVYLDKLIDVTPKGD